MLKRVDLKGDNLAKVTFKVLPEVASEHKNARLVGEFNEWGQTDSAMKRHGDGSFSLSMELPKGRDYQFRYLLGEDTWVNDEQADSYRHCDFANCENSVLSL